MDKKANIGRPLSFVVSSILILLVVFGFYYSLKVWTFEKIDKPKEDLSKLNTEMRIFSLFKTRYGPELFPDLILKKNFALFGDRLKEFFGKNVKCTVLVDGKSVKKDQGIDCKTVDSISRKASIKLPTYSSEKLDKNNLVDVSIEVVA